MGPDADIYTLRGVIEKTIDLRMEKNKLVKTHKFFEALKPSIKNRLDAVFGFVVGQIFSDLDVYFYLTQKRLPNPEEINEVSEVIVKRLNGIKSRVLETNV